MATPANTYRIDQIDIWTQYGVLIENGTDGFLKYPERKQSIVNDWPDQPGLDIDLTTPVFREREIQLRCGIIANNETDFWDKYNLFITLLMMPGVRMFFSNELGRSYRVVYKKCEDFQRFTRIKDSTRVAAKFTLHLIEPNPKSIITNSVGVPITDGQGNYIYG